MSSNPLALDKLTYEYSPGGCSSTSFSISPSEDTPWKVPSFFHHHFHLEFPIFVECFHGENLFSFQSSLQQVGFLRQLFQLFKHAVECSRKTGVTIFFGEGEFVVCCKHAVEEHQENNETEGKEEGVVIRLPRSTHTLHSMTRIVLVVISSTYLIG